MATETRDDCEVLAVALANAKREESQAKAARIEAEEKLAAALGGKESGSSSFACGCLKVTVKRGMNYTISNKAWFEDRFPNLCKITRKVEVDETAYEDARTSNPDIFSAASELVTVTPKKVAVEIKM